ncbi:MAG: hypothetical protein M1816_005684 [Peltula sp. TS41687]|nr:MAG: hypothetical protein M1816_005684 [Peltula sp. TS41687]
MATFPTSPIAGIRFPSTDLIKEAFAYVNEHNIPSTVHHCIRSAFFALIIRGKDARLNNVDPETIVVTCLLHDLGWSETATIRSPDKRFEVDGANAARELIRAKCKQSGSSSSSSSAGWDDEQRLQGVWDAIALHTTPSIAQYGQPLVAVVSRGIGADFFGPNAPGGVITVEEFRDVIRAYPRIQFSEQFVGILCGLCREKPDATYDNFVGDFGRTFVEGYKEEWEERRTDKLLLSALENTKQFED